MKIEQIYTGCLAEAAYYIQSDGQAAIIDPLREAEPYLKRAAKDGATIRYIFETHFHADFVSGHVELSEKSGAPIVYGPTAKTAFKSYTAADGEAFKIGRLTIVVLHTPGHTPESTTYLLKDENGKDYCIFTGDTLFIGDVGRPDLAQKGGLTMEDMAATLYDSLHRKIMPLSDQVIIYPAHGAGSACGKNMSKETFDTLGNQKKTNYALKAKSKEEFVKEVTAGLLPPPQYFRQNAALNKEGYNRLEEVLAKGLNPLSPQNFEEAASHLGALIIDTRDGHTFAKGFIPKSINIGLNGQFAPWIGALVKDIKQPILLVAEKEKVKEAITRLARVGYDQTLGYLEGGFNAWKAAGKETDKIRSVSAEEFEKEIAPKPNLIVLDVRRPGEYEAEHLENALTRPLDFINEWIEDINKNDKFYIHCAGGYRSMIAASILKARGFNNVIDVEGGYAALKNTALKRTDFVCPSKIEKV